MDVSDLWELLYGVFCIFLLYAVIGTVWYQVEIKIYGKVLPSKIDTVVAIVLAVSLYFNFK